MPPDFFVKLIDNIPLIKYCKIEAPPTPSKISAIRRLTGDRLILFGGLGGLFLLDELSRGASGAMTGFAFPEILVDICRNMSEGNTHVAQELFHRWLPLILFEIQEGIDLSIRKSSLHYRGLIEGPTVRAPGAFADEKTLRELTEHIENLNN